MSLHADSDATELADGTESPFRETEARDSILLPKPLTPEEVRDAAARGVVIFVRQSEFIEANSGSRALQIDGALEAAAVLGTPRERVRVIEAWGERATADANRAKFQELRQLVQAGQAGVIIVPEHHRLSRNLADAEALFADCATAGTFINVSGKTWNPADEGDRFFLSIVASQAQYENRLRSRWHRASKLKKAALGQLAISLPSGLVWVAEDDAEYRRRARAAGLDQWLGSDGHYTNVRANHSTRRRLKAHSIEEPSSALAIDSAVPRRFIRPFPDQEVVQAITLLLNWVRETESLAVILRRVREGSDGWPAGRAGTIPRVGGWHFDPHEVPRWVPPRGRRPLSRWLASPALFGIYAIYAESLVAGPTQRARRSRRKGAHFPRALRQRQPLFPTWETLLGTPSQPPSERSAAAPSPVYEVDPAR